MGKTMGTNAKNGDEGIDYGPDFDQNVGAVLKTRLLAAVHNFRKAEDEYARMDREFIEVGNRWSKAQETKDFARNELINASSSWESWERQQLQANRTRTRVSLEEDRDNISQRLRDMGDGPEAPQTRQEGPGTTEAPDPLKIDAEAFFRP